ncbi:MAG: choice-of-anchor J domain-containing protein [Bacteroidales bacterium]|nr:choice-of-anchor J domain-containing protein [Bacteroidales bacterium]
MTNTRLQNVTRKALFLLMMVLLGSTSLLRADELTVYDGTTTNSYVPIYGFYADCYVKSEYVIPADDLADMNGGTIDYMKFYLSAPSSEALTGTFQVYLAEVADATISAFYDGEVTVVYEGTVNTTESIMTIEFTESYEYNGGNLLVGFVETSTGNYKSCTFYGETVSDASVQGYNCSSPSSISPSPRNFIPKTTFIYEAGSGGTKYQVSAIVNPEGAGVVTGTGKYYEDSQCTLTATPSSSAYYFVNWTNVEGEEVSTSSEYTFTVTEDVTFIANFGEYTSYQIAAVANPDVYGYVTGTGTYFEGEQCTLTAYLYDNQAYYFINWTLNGEEVSKESSYTFTVTSDAEYVANFGLYNIYSVTLSTNPENAGFIFSGEGQFYENMTSNLIAMSSDDYLFVNWTKDGEVFATSPYYQVVVTEDLNLVANFVQYDGTTYYDGSITNQWTPVWLSNAGNYLQSQFVMPAEDLTDLVGKSIKGLKFYVDSDETYMYFSEFRVYMTEHPTETINSFIDMNSAVTVYDGVLSMRNNEMIISFNTPYDYYGGNLLIGINNIVPDGAHYVEFYGVDKRDASISNSSNSNNFGNFYAMQTNFLPKTTFFFDEDLAPMYSITAAVNPEDAGYVEGTGEYSEGYTCTLTAVKNPGYAFVNWTLNGEEVSTSATYSFTVTGAAEYVANFEESSVEDIDLTVFDGTLTNGYVPVYGFYADAYLKSQTVYPAEALTEIAGGTITSIKFYSSNENVSWGAASFQVYMTEVPETTLSDFVELDPSTMVYEGSLSIVDNEMVVTLLTPYIYRGGNLLVGVYNTVQASYVASNWYGTTVEGASVQGYSYNGLDAIAASQRNFIPKTTFSAEVDFTPALLSVTPDPINMGYRPLGAWMKTFWFGINNQGGNTTVNDMYIDNDYFQLGYYNVPFELPNSGLYNMDLYLGAVEAGEVNANLVINYGNDKTALFPISAYAYYPVAGDVWENALEVTVPFVGTAPAGIYHNYDIPGGNATDIDAVYKVEVDKLSVMEVTTGDVASTVAIYTEEGFDGVGGPDVDNAYQYSLPIQGSVGEGEWYYYDDGFNQDAIGTGGGNFWWAVMFPAGSYYGNMVTKVACYDYTTMTGTVTIYNDNASVPTTAVGMADVYMTGSGEFVEVEFETPVAIDPSKNVWVVYYNGSGASNPASVCNNTGDANGRWVSLDGVNWNDLAGYGLDYTFMIRVCIAEGYRGEVTEITVPQQTASNMGTLACAGTFNRNGGDAPTGEFTVAPGTYYVVVAAGEEEFPVSINLNDVPAPVAAQMLYPADLATGITEPCVLRWSLGEYTEEMQVLCGTQYPPTDVLIDWTDELVNSVALEELLHNTMYFVQINERNYTGTTEGEITSFTSYLDVPELYADTWYVYEDESIHMYWDAIEDEGLLAYNVYLNDTLVASVTDTEFAVRQPEYNLSNPYIYQITAQYELGESDKSNYVLFYVSGYGTVEGHVYEQDGVTPIADATVVLYGDDVFGDYYEYEFTTDGEGAYNGTMRVGNYYGWASKEGYQLKQHGLFYIGHDTNLEGVDFVMNEEYTPVAEVVAVEVDTTAQVTWTLNEGDRSLQYFRLYRSTAYSNVAELIADSLFTNEYVDETWASVEMGAYRYGVSAMYQGNRETNRDGEFVYGFENDLEGWTNIIVNTDGGEWLHSSEQPYGYDYTELAHTGTGFAICYSYVDYQGAFNTDAYLISPQMYTIAENSTMTFWADNANDSYPEDFSVCVSTAVEPTANDFVEIWSGGAKGTNNEGAIVRHTNNRYQNWREHVVDLSAYAGQTVWIAFHDVNYDMYEVWIDDVVIAAEGAAPSAHPSAITWSNIIDKDMYTTLSITVTLNSGDSPEGAEVYINNVDQNENINFPVEPVVLDETGTYTWDSFRKGEYEIAIIKDGYYSIGAYYTTSIYEPTELEYEMIEVVSMAENLYVSPTGWAMWDEANPGLEQPNPYEPVEGTTFTEGFEGGIPADWTVIDGNDDGYTWTLTSAVPSTWTYYASQTLDWYHSGSDAVVSGSYINGPGALTPDDYLVTPMVTLVDGSTLNFWAAATDASYPADHFGVFVSEDAENWTMVDEWTLTAKKGAANGGRESRDGSGAKLGSWYEYSVDLSAYAGEKYIAFRHFNCNDQYIMCIDDVELVVYNKGMRHYEAYNVVLTDLEGNELYSDETTEQQMQLPVEDLVEGEYYIFKVAKVFSSATSEYAEVEWIYTPCENYDGATSQATTTLGESNIVMWEGVVTTDVLEFNLYDTYGDGWNGGYLTLTMDDGTVVTVTMESGSYESFLIQTKGNTTITYTAGGWSYENYFEVKRDGEVLLAVNSGDLNTGWEYTVEGSCQVLVLRDDEIIGFVSGTEYIDEGVTDPHDYSIRVVYPDYAMSCEQQAEFKATCTVTANAGEGGLVNGTEVYTETFLEGDVCSLMASTYDDYVFNNWTKDGQEVSTDSWYTFTVTGNETYTANFVDMSNFYIVDPNAYESNMTLTGIVKIDGVEQDNRFLEVSAWSGDEVRGTAYLEHVALTIGENTIDRYFVLMTVYGNEGDELTFKLYNHSTAEELDIMCTSNLTFEADENYGSLTDPYVINFMNVIAVDYQFTPGWNWWSTHVELSSINGLEMLEDGLGASSAQIASQSAFTKYYESFGWYGSLTSINNESMYRIKVNEGETPEVTMTGAEANPEDHPITIKNGWNHIGFISGVQMSVTDALAGLTPQPGDMIKTQKAYAKYYDTYGWYGSLSTIVPGDGLMYKSSNVDNIQFTYPATSRSEYAENLTGDNNHWVPNVYAYPYNMTVMAVVEMEGVELASDDYEVAAFANGECRGSVRLIYSEVLNRYVAFLTISGEEATSMRFGLYNTVTGEEFFDTDAALTYSTDEMVGDPDAPFVISFRGTNLNGLANDVMLYPNPAASGEKVSVLMSTVSEAPVRIEIVDALGKLVSVETATNWPASITVPSSNGVYTVRIITENNGVMIQKLIVR